MNRVTICRAKCLGIVTLKVLPTGFARYNSEEKAKLNRINVSYPV